MSALGRVSLMLLALGLLPQGASGQKDTAALPRRPALSSNQDTNSAAAYYFYGVSQLTGNAQRAADAFAWATRLDPSMAEAWYGRWAARLLEETPATSEFYEGIAVSVEVRFPADAETDSLRTKALMREPLLFMRLDAVVANEWMRRGSVGQMTLEGDDDPELRGMFAYSDGRFQDAERLFTRALRAAPRYYWLHLDLARAFVMHQQYDSALSELHHYLEASERHKNDDPVVGAASEEMIQYTIGRIQELKKDIPAAKATYTQILVANLGFYPAHVALGRMALTEGDTAMALKEYELATVIADAPTCYDFGMLLLRRDRAADAAEQFRRAIQVDSDYIQPYFPLAYLEETAGDDSVAAALYRRFIARAPRAFSSLVARARGRLAGLPGIPSSQK